MKIKTISRAELEKIPEGPPIPSVCPQEGYGNHSCNDCLFQNCPIDQRTSTPNQCSFYWPPNMPEWKPSYRIKVELHKIARERQKNE